MAKGFERVGDKALKVTFEFPDGKMRDDFEVAFQGWIKQYQQAAATQRLVGALAQKELAGEAENDTSGHLFRIRDDKWGYTVFYLDFI